MPVLMSLVYSVRTEHVVAAGVAFLHESDAKLLLSYYDQFAVLGTVERMMCCV